MEAIAISTRSKRVPKIPDNLIWEVLDGQPLYRRGYMDVENKNAFFEKNSYQQIILSYTIRLLQKKLNADTYDIMLGNLGIQLNQIDFISNDIAIFNRLSANQITKKYADYSPKIVIEIDIDIDPSSMPDLEYLDKKTKKMLAFGVEKVIWILTNNREVIVATPNEPWQTLDWNTTIEIIDGISFNIHNYLEERGINI